MLAAAAPAAAAADTAVDTTGAAVSYEDCDAK